MNTKIAASSLALSLMLGLALVPAAAATFIVSNTDDAGDGSLRAAILAANANAGHDVIEINASGTIALESALPILIDSVDIIGPGAQQLVIDANQEWRHFRLAGALGTSYRLQGLTLRNGYSDDVGGAVMVLNNASLIVEGCIIEDNVALAQGGGIAAYGPVQISNSILRGNTGVFGGGLYLEGQGHAVRQSALLLNSAQQGGGIYVGSAAELELENATIAGNMAQTDTDDGFGGGIILAAGITAISHVTFADNLADLGAGIALIGGQLTTFANNVLGNNFLWNEQPSNCLGNLPDDFANLSSDATCQLFGDSDLQNTDPMLASLDLNGGSTPSLMPLPGSPVIDSAASSFCSARDQRDLLRPETESGLCDRGSIEVYPAIDHPDTIFFDGFEALH